MAEKWKEHSSPTTSATHCLEAEDEFSGSTRRAVSLVCNAKNISISK